MNLLLLLSLTLLQAGGVTLHTARTPCAVPDQPSRAPKRESLKALVQREAQALGAEVESFEVRAAGRWKNVVALVGGAPIVDPGYYRLELRLSGGAVHASLEYTPTVRGLFFSNGFRRESALQECLRRQWRELRSRLRTACPASGAPTTGW